MVMSQVPSRRTWLHLPPTVYALCLPSAPTPTPPPACTTPLALLCAEQRRCSQAAGGARASSVATTAQGCLGGAAGARFRVRRGRENWELTFHTGRRLWGMSELGGTSHQKGNVAGAHVRGTVHVLYVMSRMSTSDPLTNRRRDRDGSTIC